MPLTAEQYQQLIIEEVSDDAAGTLDRMIQTLWTKHDDQDDLVLHYLHTKRSAIVLMLGKVRFQVSFKALDGASADLDQLTEHLQTMQDAVDTAIASTQAGSSSGGASAPLTRIAPIGPDDALPTSRDANDRRYRGDPYGGSS